MAARQSVLKPAPHRPDLDRLMTASIKAGVTDDQLQDQRVSFAYGNAPEGWLIPLSQGDLNMVICRG